MQMYSEDQKKVLSQFWKKSKESSHLWETLESWGSIKKPFKNNEKKAKKGSNWMRMLISRR